MGLYNISSVYVMYLDHFILLGVVLDDRQCLLPESHQPLLDGLLVVVSTATELTPLKQTLGHHFLAALKHNHLGA